MTEVFADTNFYIALLRPDDVMHERCVRFDREYIGRFLTSEFVLIELGNWLADPRNRSVFVEVNRILRSHPRTTILPASTDWFARGMTLYEQRHDKDWSLTDCISFEMMREHGITHALTGDRHFEQAGFVAVFK